MPADDSGRDPSPTDPPPDRKLVLLRFAVRAVRVTASTIAVVAVLRQQWVAAGAFAVFGTWLRRLRRKCTPVSYTHLRAHET